MENLVKEDKEVLPIQELQNLSFTDNDDQAKENMVNEKLRELFKDYFLSEMQSLAAFKFIKDKFLKDTKDAERVKKWVLMKINNRMMPEGYNPRQLGCPDLVPGLTVRSFWDPTMMDWVNELVDNFETIRTELINLRAEAGFQPYKSPKFASDIKVVLFLFINSQMIILDH
jgi:hypothetical protein